MKICVPTMDARGLSGELAEFIGRAPYFTVVDRDSGRVETLANPDPRRRAGAGPPVELLRAGEIGAVVCRGLGRGALERLQEVGVPVFVSSHTHVSSAVRAFCRGEVHAVTSAIDCRGGLAQDH